MFSEHFDESTRDLMADRRMAFVVPQESLRHAIQSVFSRLPSMSEVKVLTAFEVGESEEDFDLVIVDEAHRLNQYAMQAHGTQLKRFRDITTKLFGHLDEDKNQLDWIRAKSRHVVLMLDLHQSVRPADIPAPSWRPSSGRRASVAGSTPAHPDAGRRRQRLHRLRAGSDGRAVP